MITLSAIQQDDLPTVAEIANRAFGTASWDVPAVESHVARYRGRLEDSRIARLGGEPVGYALLGYPREGEAELSHIGVVPEARRRGVARAMLGETAAIAAGHGRKSLWARTREQNSAAQACYRAAGFELDRREPSWEITMPAEPPLPFLESVVFRPIEEPLEMYDWYDHLPLAFDGWTFEQYRYLPGRHQAYRATRHGETIAVAYVVHTPDGGCVAGKLRLAEMADWIPEFLRAAARPGRPFRVTDVTGRYGQWFASWNYAPSLVRVWMRRALGP